jgi:hypothetical protein
MKRESGLDADWQEVATQQPEVRDVQSEVREMLRINETQRGY